MLPLVGEICLHSAFVAAILTMMLGIIAGLTGARRYTNAACYGSYVVFGLMAAASSVLLHALLTHNFDLVTVATYSDTRMPAMYLMAAFWGGQAGSLTFWTGMLSVFVVLAVSLHRKTDRALIPWFIAVVSSLQAFLMFILLMKSNPFDTFLLMDAPPEGEGLNPLLQTPLMVMHPPSLLTGYVSMAIPFAFGMAALISGKLDNAWLAPARRWVLVSWLFLSIGNMLGGMWAYEELGWGGYWAWDPVENAALLPWIAATAFLHSIMIQERRGMLRRWNVVLVTISFLLTLLGTFITRSGLIESVHTFAQSSIGDYFAALLITYTTLSIVFLAVRWKDLASKAKIDSPLSRESVFVANNWILMGMTFVVFWGTLFPKFKEWVTGDKVSVGPPWFNKYMVPLAVVLVLLMGIGTLISWRKATWKNFQRNFITPLVATLILTPLLCAGYWFLRADSLNLSLVPSEVGYAIAGVSTSLFVICASVSEYWRGIAARRRRTHNGKRESILEAGLNLIAKQRRRYGGYIVHIGFVLCIIGFSGNAFKVEQDVSMKTGDTIVMGDYDVRFDRMFLKQDHEKQLYVAKITVLKEGETVSTVYPGRAVFHSNPRMPTSEIAIDTGIGEDLYFALTGFSPDLKQASFKMFIAPLVWWFWFGASVLIFGTLICLWPESSSTPSNVYYRASRSTAATAVALAVSFSPVFVWSGVVVAQTTPTAPAAEDNHVHTEDAPIIRVHNPRLKRLMSMIRVSCKSQGDPVLSQSLPTCQDFQRDLATIESMLKEGKSDQEILDHFVALRGTRVLAIPPDENMGWLSWGIPIGLLCIAVPVLVWRVRTWSNNAPEETSAYAATDTSADDSDEGDDLLDDDYQDRLNRELSNL